MESNDKKDFKFMCILCMWMIIVFTIAILFGNEDAIIGHLVCCLIAFLLIQNKKFNKE